MSSSDETLRGRLLEGRYRIEDLIARGGMAAVYRATDTRLDRVVAVKVMHANLSADPSFATRFVREAQAAAKLNHPNVVAVFDQGEDAGTAYLVMELVEGRTLRDPLRTDAPMPPQRALALLEPVLLALAAAHEARIVHRDVKPENVLLAPDGRVKVADFGLARAVTSVTGGGSSTSTGVLIGTVSYLAPELVLDQGADARSDVYACGAVLYEMLTGQKPHSGETPIQIAYRHVHENVPPPSEQVTGIPPYVDALVARATARDRDQRSADARVLLRQLRQVRHALERRLPDAPDLTADLLPRSIAAVSPASAEVGESTLIVGDAAGAVQAPPNPAGTAEPQAAYADAPVPTTSPAGAPPPAQSAGGDSTAPIPPLPPKRRGRGLIWLSVVVLFAVLATVGGFYLGVMRYSTTPELVGETERSAQQIAETRGLDIEVAEEQFSERVPEGRIIETEPQAGADILDGGTVDVTVSKGKERYEVPNLKGLSEKEARDQLKSGELRLGEVSRRFSERVADGDVIRTGTDAGKRVRPDTAIDLYVSKGRRPIDITSYEGEHIRVARRELRDAGFDVDVTRKNDGDVPARRVISQNPNSGTAHRDDTIELVVSRGPVMVTVPDLQFRSVEDATRELEELGLEVETTEDELNVGADIVRGQDPAAGERVPRGTTVQLSIV